MVLVLSAPCLPGAEWTESFDAARPGTLPDGWSASKTGPGASPRWEVVKDGSAPSPPGAFAQLSESPEDHRFPLAVRDDGPCRDGVLSVRFKPVSGRLDRAGGLVWRYRDPENYYLVRANALEDNVVLYKVEGGKRTSLAPIGTSPRTYGVKHKVPSGRWSELRVGFEGPRFVVSFDGATLFEVEDRTFSEAGRVGVWTKADSVTYFDDFRLSKK